MKQIRRISKATVKRVSTYFLTHTPEKVLGKSGVKLIVLLTDLVNQNTQNSDEENMQFKQKFISPESIQRPLIRLITAIHLSDISENDMKKIWLKIFDLWSVTIDYCDISYLCDQNEFNRLVHELQLVMEELVKGEVSRNDLDGFFGVLDLLSENQVVNLIFLSEYTREERKEIGLLLRNLWKKLFGKDEKVYRRNSLQQGYCSSVEELNPRSLYT